VVESKCLFVGRGVFSSSSSSSLHSSYLHPILTPSSLFSYLTFLKKKKKKKKKTVQFEREKQLVLFPGKMRSCTVWFLGTQRSKFKRPLIVNFFFFSWRFMTLIFLLLFSFLLLQIITSVLSESIETAKSVPEVANERKMMQLRELATLNGYLPLNQIK